MKKNISAVTEKMVNYFDGDVRRVNHALKVHSFARCIGKFEKLAKNELFIIEVTALLHDIGIKISEEKYNSSSGRYQEIEGPPVAREILKDFKIEQSILDRICYLIGNHHSYSRIDRKDFQILIEADFLVNIYEESMDKESIGTIKEKYFKTEAGKRLISSLYKV